VAAPVLHRALINLVVAKVTAAEGLDTGLLARAARMEPSLPPLRLHDTADLHLGLWSRFVDDVDTARSALQRCITRARDAGDDFALWIIPAYLAVTEELAGDYAAAAATLRAADASAAGYDWPPNPWVLEPRCELLIATGNLDGALRILDEQLPDSEGAPVPVRYMGACVRGKVSAWRGDLPAVVRHFELAARCADLEGWADPGVRDRLDAVLAEAYVALGRTGDAMRISAWLREVGGRLGRPALTANADRIDALARARATSRYRPRSNGSCHAWRRRAPGPS